MQSAVVVLERSLLIPKETWREPGCRRTLVPVETASLIRSAWTLNQPTDVELACIVWPLGLDGSAGNAATVHPVQGKQKGFVGVFDVAFLALDEVKVTLREQECLSRTGSPRRPTRTIAMLRPWRPVRVLLNGRWGSSSGQYYQLREYHLALCTGATPEALGPTRNIDLQADLH